MHLTEISLSLPPCRSGSYRTFVPYFIIILYSRPKKKSLFVDQSTDPTGTGEDFPRSFFLSYFFCSRKERGRKGQGSKRQQVHIGNTERTPILVSSLDVAMMCVQSLGCTPCLDSEAQLSVTQHAFFRYCNDSYTPSSVIDSLHTMSMSAAWFHLQLKPNASSQGRDFHSVLSSCINNATFLLHHPLLSLSISYELNLPP